MSKEKLKRNGNPVGATSSRPHFEGMAKKEKGITLIALVITIIVMLILVGVSVTVALNGGLFTTANKAKQDTATERDKELNLSDGKVTINGEEYNSIDEYVNVDGETDTSSEITWTKTSEGELAVGSTVVTSTGENFYVIGFAGTNNETVKLLAKDCIILDETSEDYLKQSASAGRVAFSSTNYWSSETEFPLDLNNYTIPEGVTTIPLTTAKTYGANLGGTGRLMTKEEAEALQTANSDILYGTNGKSSGTSLDYWLGSAGEDISVNFVGGGLGLVSVSLNGSGPYCVRPVVEISKSSIS